MESLPPVGFWSYERTDDELSRGNLSALRRIFRRELQIRVGRTPLKMRESVDPEFADGSVDWERQISDALAESSFMVVFMTPAYFQSEYRARELLQFHARELSLGRQGLIFPILYVDIDHINPADPGACVEPRVWEILMRRQNLDLRDARLNDPERSPEIWSRVGDLARAIVSSLQPSVISSYLDKNLKSKHFRDILTQSRVF